ncbi:MAG: trigger factor [Chthoniobacter sp.]|nr:trigger factor [Chthoniobacter sp.]
MNVVVENLPNCITTLRIELEPEKVNKAWEAVTADYTRYAKLPGYRPGKAPKAVIEKKFKKQIREELEKKLLSDSCREAISEKKLRVLSLAQIDDVELADDKTMKFTATLVTHPDFELPTYKGLTVEMKSTDVTEAEIDESLENLREQAADFTNITEERGAAMDDYVVVDYTGTIEGKPVHEAFPKAGKPLSGNEDFWIRMTPEAFFPGYAAALVGAKPGETRTFVIDVPEEFPVAGMGGQKIQYVVKLKEIKMKVLPMLDDAFADTVAKGKTLAELRTMAREELARQKKTDAEASKRSAIMTQILEKVECELPVDMVRTQTRRILADIVRENQERGIDDEVLKENEQQILGKASEGAREQLKGTFVLLRIAEAEGIQVTKLEFSHRINQLSQRYQMKPAKLLKELEKRNAIDQITEEILTAKTLEFLASNATVADAPVETPAAE